MGEIYPMCIQPMATFIQFCNERAAWLGSIFMDQMFMAIMVPAYPHEMNTG